MLDGFSVQQRGWLPPQGLGCQDERRDSVRQIPCCSRLKVVDSVVDMV
jgi:hypothetical protein